MSTRADGEQAHGAVTTRLWRDGRPVDKDLPLDQVSEHLRSGDCLLWVDLRDPDHALLGQLAEELELDRHAVEDAITEGERPKATRHATHTFVTVYATSLVDDGPAKLSVDDPASRQSRVRTSRVSAFLLPHGLVTVRSDDGFDLGPVLERWDEDPELLRFGVGALLHGLLDTIVDGHFTTIQDLDDAVEGIDDLLFDDRVRTREVQVRTFRLRKELVEVRRVVLPMRDVVTNILRHRSALAERHEELDGYFDDLYDHVLRASEWTESLRDLVTTVFETNLSLQDARLNTVMKKLTGWAAIIAVPTAVTGWFGQNVPVPGFEQGWGVALSALVIAGTAGLLYLVFRRKDWL